MVFEREVARAMVCHSLVNFSIKDDELRSGEINVGEFASFCELRPGRYRYKVVRPNPRDGALDAARRLEGIRLTTSRSKSECKGAKDPQPSGDTVVDAIGSGVFELLFHLLLAL